MAGAGFGGPLLLSFTLIMTFITVGVKVSCLLRFTLAASSVAHKSPFGDSGLILCWSRIRKFVTYREYTDRQTEKAITEATLIPWIAGLSGPTTLDCNHCRPTYSGPEERGTISIPSLHLEYYT